MQARSQPASLIAYKLGEFHPGVLEVMLMTIGYFPSKVNRVHNNPVFVVEPFRSRVDNVLLVGMSSICLLILFPCL